MPLENMSLAEAIDFTSYLSTCVEAAKDLDALGYVPILDVTPGEPICITVTGHQVPDFAVHEDLFAGAASQLARDPRASAADFAALHDRLMATKPELVTKPPSPLPPEPVADDAPPVARAVATGDDEPEPAGDVLPDPAEVAGVQAPATEDGGGRSAVNEAAPAVSIPLGVNQAPAWTVLEDDRLIAYTVAKMVVHGIGKLEAIRQAAAEIGRPFESAKTRLYSNRSVKDRFSHSLAAAEAERDSYKAAVAGRAPEPKAAEPDLPKSALDVYLFGLPRGGRDGWDWLRDAELMRLSCQGFGIQDIAADLGMDSAAIKARFDLLTGNHKDGDGKWHRRFTREDVLSAIEAQAGQAVQ